MDEISKWVENNYSLGGKVTSKLLRSYTNDVYLIETLNKKFVLKLYDQIWRTKEEVLWEVDLTNHLLKKGVLVGVPVKSSDNEIVKTMYIGKNKFTAVLFKYAKGDKPQPPFTPDLYYKFGKAAAKLHKESNDFTSIYSRPNIDLKYLIDDSLMLAKGLTSKRELESLINFGSKLKNKINNFTKLDMGIVHGDLTLDNLHITKSGDITFYDFDSAGFGYRAMELQGWVVLNPELKSNIDAYSKGYREIRDIDENNFKAASFLQAAQDMWLRKGMKALNSPEILEQQLQRVRQWIKYFGE